jgi:hypothetical protein
MTKILVDAQTDAVRGRYEEPLDFSISGRYVIDIPAGFGIDPTTSSLASLIQEKIDTFVRLHPALPNNFYDEFLTAPPPNVDPTNSTRYFVGPNKRTALLPNGGEIVTNTLTTIAGFNTTYFHIHGFLLYSEPGDSSASHPSPSRLLYNYNGTAFETFDYNDFLIEYHNTPYAPPGSLIQTVTPELEDTSWIEVGAKSFVIRIRNINTSRIYYLSDWMFLYSNP